MPANNARACARCAKAGSATTVLFLSPRTIDNHAQRIMNKLGMHSRAELTRFAVREGIIDA